MENILLLVYLIVYKDIDCHRWTSTIVALPIVMYTSWILYERGKFFTFIVF